MKAYNADKLGLTSNSTNMDKSWIYDVVHIKVK
jgi:hypothetical protein